MKRNKKPYRKNPLVDFAVPNVAKEVESAAQDSKSVLAHNPFVSRKAPMKVSLAPLPAHDETPEQVDERENPMNPFIQAGIEAVGGSLGGWLVSFLAASAITSIANGENPSTTMTRVVFYGAGIGPALTFSFFGGKSPATWQGALAGSALYPVIADTLNKVQGGPA
jgi:hypothetical protein